MHYNLTLGPFPRPWEWREWAIALNTELCRVVAPYGPQVMEWLAKAEDLDGVPDKDLRQSDEFPRLDMLLASELYMSAKTVCKELAIRMKTLQERSMAVHSVAPGRELYRFYVRYFLRPTTADTTYQWMDIAQVRCDPGGLAELCARWDDALRLSTRQPPADFLLSTFLKQVARETKPA